MLEKLLVRWFQNHDKKLVEFDSYFTCIIGESYAGKTAILRALRWVCLNRPTGVDDDFIQHGKKETKVSLWVDGHKISRTKGKENAYFLDGVKLKAFGTGVPGDIESILSVDEENFQRQLELPYWFFKTPGEVSRELNRIVNLDLIDRVMSNLGSKQRSNKAELEVSRKRLKEATESLECLEWVEEADRDLQEIEALESDMARKRTWIASLRSLLQDRSSARLSLQNASQASQDAYTIEYLIQQLEDLQAERNKLTVLLEEREEACRNLREAKEDLRTAKEELEEVSKQLQETCPQCGQPLLES